MCVFPRYAPSFGSFEFSYPLTDGVRAFMPPQGLLVIAAAVPPSWQVRFIDENMAPASDDDFAWAEVVFVSGMHVQRRQIEDIRRRAHALDRIAVLGGSSVSACPEHYPEFDYLHVGELGDATDELFARLDATIATRPPHQVVLTTRERRELTDFPLPAYELAQLDRYLHRQHPVLQRLSLSMRILRHPRALRPQPALQDAGTGLRRARQARSPAGCPARSISSTTISSRNRRAVRELLPHLIEWQKRNGYPLFASPARRR